VIAGRSLRRRADFALLRWQARLDGAWADRVLPAVATAGLFVVLAGTALARARSVDTGVDLAVWVQGAWLITEGLVPESTITGAHLFEAQAAVGFVPIAMLTRFAPPIPTLIIVQSLALALTVVPVWVLCRRVCDLRVGASLAVIIAVAVYPPLHALNLADFHPEAVALPLVVAAALFGLTARWRWLVVVAVVAVSLRADLALAIAAVGVLVAWDGHRRQGGALFVASLGWFAVSLLVVQPAIGGGGFVHADAFAEFGSTVPGVLWQMATRPVDVLAAVLSENSFAVVVGLLAPVAFLPVLVPRYLYPILPVLGLLLVADVPLGPEEGIERLVPVMAFVLVALPFALARIGRRSIERVLVDRRVLGALILASLVFFVRDSPSSPYREPWGWGGRDATDRALLDAVTLVDDSDRVRAVPPVLAELASRRTVYALDGAEQTPTSLVARGVEVVLVDERSTPEWGPLRRAAFTSGLADEGFAVVLDRAGVQLFVRERTAPSGD